MKTIARSLWLVLFAAASLHAQAPAPGSTTVVLVRHAERAADDPKDPALTAAGQARAEALAAALAASEVSAVYVTQYKRNHATAAPLAKRFGLTATERPVTPENTVGYAAELAKEVLAKQAGKTVVIVGHSDTVPDLVKAFSGHSVAPLAHEDYDRIYIVVVPPSGPARLFQARYGEPSGPPHP